MASAVRVAVIGCGERGKATISRWLQLPGVSIVAVCDINPDAVKMAQLLCAGQGVTVTTHSDWMECLALDRYDLVYICTNWDTHASIAMTGMELGQNIAVEIPMATTIEDCIHVKRMAEESGRYFTMLENCCYDPFHLSSLQMVRDGALGELRHCEGAYIHDLRDRYGDGWYKTESEAQFGNPYPTHGIGPICQLLDIGNSDRLKTLVSMSTADGGINSTLINTELGRSILLQYDRVTPRPYSRLQTVCGSNGYISKYPIPTLQLNDNRALTGRDAERIVMSACHPWIEKYQAEGERLGVTNIMNYIMDCRLFETLRHYLDTGIAAPDITPMDAALWSIIAPLTHLSVSHGNKPLHIPDLSTM